MRCQDGDTKRIWGHKADLREKKDHTYNASSRLRSSSTSTLMVSGYVTVNVSVHGNEGSSAMVARMRSMAILSARS